MYKSLSILCWINVCGGTFFSLLIYRVPRCKEGGRLFRLCGGLLDYAHAGDARWVEGPIAVRICGAGTETRREGDGPSAS